MTMLKPRHLAVLIAFWAITTISLFSTSNDFPYFCENMLMGCIFLACTMAFFWPVTLAIYSLAIWLQFLLSRKIEDRGGRASIIRRIASAQIALPFLYFVLYPFMPGRTSAGEPLGLNEKALLASLITSSAILLSIAASALLIIIRYRQTRTHTEQPPSPYGSPAAGSPSGEA